MAPQTSIPLAANVLGTIGTVFWCIQLLPQIWHNWRKKSTEGLPGLMLFMWAICAVPFGVYAIVQNFNIPIQIQPQIFGTLSLASWAQTLIYTNGWKTWKATLLAVGVGIMFGAVEAVLIVTLKGPYDRGIEWPMLLIGIIAAVLIGGGLFPPYYEIWKRRGRVVGFNWIFLSIDWMGAFFSLMALVAQHTFDVLGGVIYIVCLVLEAGIFISQCLWLLRTRDLRKRAELEGVKFDDLPEARKYQDNRSEKPEGDNVSPSTNSVGENGHPNDLEQGNGVISSSNASIKSRYLKDRENGNGIISSSNASIGSSPPKEAELSGTVPPKEEPSANT